MQWGGCIRLGLFLMTAGPHDTGCFWPTRFGLCFEPSSHTRFHPQFQPSQRLQDSRPMIVVWGLVIGNDAFSFEPHHHSVKQGVTEANQPVVQVVGQDVGQVPYYKSHQ